MNKTIIILLLTLLWVSAAAQTGNTGIPDGIRKIMPANEGQLTGSGRFNSDGSGYVEAGSVKDRANVDIEGQASYHITISINNPSNKGNLSSANFTFNANAETTRKMAEQSKPEDDWEKMKYSEFAGAAGYTRLKHNKGYDYTTKKGVPYPSWIGSFEGIAGSAHYTVYVSNAATEEEILALVSNVAGVSAMLAPGAKSTSSPKPKAGSK
jgi:hypothetical protein